MPDSPKPVTHRMDNLHWQETSGVDYPAHLEDGWMVLKSRQPSEEAIVPINKDALDDEVRAHIEGLEAEVTKARTETEAAVADAVAKAMKEGSAKEEASETPEEEAAEEDEDEAKKVAKSLSTLPEPVRKAFADLQARTAAAEAVALNEQATRLTSEFVAKARDLDALNVDPDTFGPVLKALAEKDPENAGLVFTVLKAANAAVAETAVFKEIGSTSTAPGGGNAYEEMTKIAKARADATPDLSFAQAMVDVATDRSDLYAQHLAEQKGA